MESYQINIRASAAAANMQPFAWVAAPPIKYARLKCGRGDLLPPNLLQKRTFKVLVSLAY